MILNRQKKVRLVARSLAQFLREIQRELRIENADVSVAFVSDTEMAAWNQAYRKKTGPTDVLSFPALTQKELDVSLIPHSKSARTRHREWARHGAPEAAVLGDIAIAPETARRYAKTNGRSLQNELRILMLHGVLHLMGYDHESDNGEMDRIEHKLRRRLGLE